MSRLGVAAALATLAVAACGRGAPEVRIGHKDFAEQRVLAHMLAELVAAETDLEAHAVSCTDTFGCQQEMRAGRIDLMVEYSGTGYLYSGVTAPAGRLTMSSLRRAYEPLGMEWLEPLGFGNAYTLVVTVNRATALGLDTISDLAEIDGGLIRVTCPEEYLHRPRDGLASLLRRHGLELRSDPLVLEDPGERLEALREGRVDVAVLYETDGALRGEVLASLDDSLGFFPPYDAAVLARRPLLKKRSGLRAVLGRLAGRLDVEAVRELNYRVQVEGWRPEVVARRFLRSEGLVEAGAAGGPSPEVVLAVPRGDRLGPQLERASRAIRAVFSERRVSVIRVSDPAAALADGRARVALLGAERFFVARRGQLQRDARLEAVAVVDSRFLHVVRKQGDERGPLAGRVGVARGSAGLAAGALVQAAGEAPAERAGDGELLAKVESGELDAALILAEPGDPLLAESLARGSLALAPLPDLNRRGEVPYLRPVRIAGGTYAGQSEPLETLGAQVVIAGPSRRLHVSALAGGPAAALPESSPPVTLAQAEALSEATGVPERPDSVLPSSWSSWSADEERGRMSESSVLDTVLNLGVLVFLAWLLTMIFRRELPAG